MKVGELNNYRLYGVNCCRHVDINPDTLYFISELCTSAVNGWLHAPKVIWRDAHPVIANTILNYFKPEVNSRSNLCTCLLVNSRQTYSWASKICNANQCKGVRAKQTANTCDVQFRRRDATRQLRSARTLPSPDFCEDHPQSPVYFNF